MTLNGYIISAPSFIAFIVYFCGCFRINLVFVDIVATRCVRRRKTMMSVNARRSRTNQSLKFISSASQPSTTWLALIGVPAIFFVVGEG